MGKIARYLNQLIVGNVFDTPEVLENYATDKSALRIRPKLVALPESTEDVRKLMRFCYQLAAKEIKIPVTLRGSGLDEMGADLGNGMVISTERLNRLLESDKRERLVRVQAGITLKEINTALSVNGLTIPVAGHDMDTIGGLISNNPYDDQASKFGGIMHYVERIEVVLANGDVLQTARLSSRSVKKKASEKTLEGSIYGKLSQLIDKNEGLLKEMRKEALGRAGYPTIVTASQKKTIDLMPLFFGAEGTLGVITEVILRAVPLSPKEQRVVATFSDFTMAQKFLDTVKPMKPRELNLYDIRIIKITEESGKKLGKIAGKLKDGFVIFAKFGGKANSSLRKIDSLRKVLPKQTELVIESNKNMAALDEFENLLVGFTAQARADERVPFLTNFYVPARNLGGLMNDLKILEEKLGLSLALYGSYSASNYNLRPKFKLDDKDFSKKATTLIRTGAFVIKRQGGDLAGGAPEGRIKALVTNDDMPSDKMALYAGIKNIFDKYEILNPGVKLGADAAYTIRHFRKK